MHIWRNEMSDYYQNIRELFSLDETAINDLEINPGVRAFDDAEDYREVVTTCIQRLVDYYFQVVQFNLTSLGAHYRAPEDQKKILCDADKERTERHDLAIGACDTLNRIARAADIEPFAPDLQTEEMKRDRHRQRKTAFRFCADVAESLFHHDRNYGDR